MSNQRKRLVKLIGLRQAAKLKQKDVARELGITTSYYGMIETGVRTPDLELAQKIAVYWNKSIEELFFDTQNNEMLITS
jgi:putative transcriptional regulator